MSKAKEKDLFDDSTMSFGEHLEELRKYLWRAILGLTLFTSISFFFSDKVLHAIVKPVQRSMEHIGQTPEGLAMIEGAKDSFVNRIKYWLGMSDAKPPEPTPAAAKRSRLPDRKLELDSRELWEQLRVAYPEHVPEPPADAKAVTIKITPQGEWFDKLEAELQRLHDDNNIPRTDGPDEAFMIYLKVSLITGLVLSSWWVFYQLWLFVAAGLYPHERKYVYRYMPMSVILFVGGVLFAFFGVIPFVLDFLFSFNTWLGLRPEMKISTWISFALMVSLMFGISFQLPLVMLFLDRLGIVTAKVYREKRRISIFAISVISMVLTPSDPVSMLMMMFPLLVLYELGILLCKTGAPVKRSPFETQPA
jgi:sec-independent protein translocase protein TatC